ncbi:MAG: ROK family protein [Enterococcus sp.]|nr:ROK family protein [Enterococcus sp.]
MISSKYTIREQNESFILNHIIKQKEISRADLSLVASLNKASVSSITKKLIDDHLVIEKRIGEATSRGRKPILLTFNPTAGVAIGLDLGYNYLDAMIAYLDGTEIKRIQQVDTYISKDNVLKMIDEIVQKLCSDLPNTPHGIIGMTIAIQGQVLNDRIVSTSHYDLMAFDLIAKLNEAYAFPISIENEANLSALGEYTFSSEFENMVSISLHSGIGAGFVKNGKLEVGNKGYAGQIGHTILFPEGRECPCGNKGCLNQYCSTQVIYQEISQLKKIEKVNSDVVKQLYYQKDLQVIQMIQKYAEYLAISVNNLIMIYAPEMVIFNSPLTKKIPVIVEIIKDYLKNRYAKEVKIMNSPIQWNPVIYGALAFSIQQFLNIEQLKLTN